MIFFLLSRFGTVCGRAFIRGCGRINDYAFSMSNEYRSVLMSTLQDCRSVPVKTTIYSTSVLGLFYLYKSNPNYNTFVTQLRAASCNLSEVGEPIRSPKSERHVNKLCADERLNKLRHLSFVFFSILWLDNASSKLKTYEASCKYLKVGWFDLVNEKRIIDFGIAGRWRNLDMYMVDYDINENEWRDYNS